MIKWVCRVSRGACGISGWVWYIGVGVVYRGGWEDCYFIILFILLYIFIVIYLYNISIL